MTTIKLNRNKPKRQLTYCWGDGTRVHILNGDKCVCLTPSVGMTNTANEFPFGFGLKECQSCYTLHKSQRTYEKVITAKPKKASPKKTAKQYKKRLAKQIREKDIKDGWTPEPKDLVKRKDKSDDFYSSLVWRELRFRALKRNDGRCELCGRSKHDGVILHVDHIKPRSRFPMLALTESNLQVMCDDCNLGKGNRDTTDWREAWEPK